MIDYESIDKFYNEYSEKIKLARKVTKHPLTLTEKFYAHSFKMPKPLIKRI